LDTLKVKRSTIIDCPRCQLINQLENKYCSKCSYPLKPEAYEELKEKEEKEIKEMKGQIETIMNTLGQLMMTNQNDVETTKNKLVKNLINKCIYVSK